ncbi:MAG TPA: Gfo/Idh/MocA family oxidoreductase [Candidatus Sulfotelmatobacter sp.]|nr:Gfo/Idh/MocA family oxidoreductase [Candidatus Sulfotelmatobacter sp.]
MKPLAVGLLGCGDVSDVYFRNCARLPAVEVVACASLHVEKARARAQEYSIPRACTIDELIRAPEVEAILNLTAPKVHAEISRAALENGKHVYTEKPLALSLADGSALVTEARRRGLRLGSAPETFLGARLQACRRAIDEGLIGAPVGATAFVVSPGHEWHHPNPAFFYKEGAGPVLDMGPYYLTALVALLGPVRRVSGFCRTTFPQRTIQTPPLKGQHVTVEVPTHVAGTMEFANGAIATMIASFDVWDSELPRIEIYGTEGTLCIPDRDPIQGPNIFGGTVLVRTRQRSRWRGIPRPRGLEDWDTLPVGTAFSENSRGLGLADMSYAIANNRPHRASDSLAYHVLEIALGLLEAAEKGGTREIASSCERPLPLPEDFPDGE